MAQKEALHIQPKQSFATAEGGENERWHWGQNAYNIRNSDSNNHYDWSRNKLNFEIVRGGKIIPLGSQSKRIDQRLYDRLQEVGWKEYKGQDPAKAPNICVEIIMSGNHDRLCEIAFGKQDVAYDLSRDNSHITRSKDIEQWALDCYNFAAKRYGEDNIVGFDVHLDETTPHIHALIVPVGLSRGRGRVAKGEPNEPKPRLSYASVFGTPRTTSKIYEQTHDDYFAEVGDKWGLERGDSIKGRDVRHLAKADYHAVQELLQTKKDLQSEVARLVAQKAQVEQSLSAQTKQLATFGKEIAKAQDELQKVTKAIEEGQVSQQEGEKELGEIKAELEEWQQKYDRKEKMIAEQQEREKDVQKRISGLAEQLKCGATIEEVALAIDGLESDANAQKGMLDEAVDAYERVQLVSKDKPTWQGAKARLSDTAEILTDEFYDRQSREVTTTGWFGSTKTEVQKETDEERVERIKQGVSDGLEKVFDALVDEADTYVKANASAKVIDAKTLVNAQATANLYRTQNRELGEVLANVLNCFSEGKGQDLAAAMQDPDGWWQRQEQQENSHKLATMVRGVGGVGSSSGGGGGSSHSDIPWGKRKRDEDESDYLQRCLPHIAARVVGRHIMPRRKR